MQPPMNQLTPYPSAKKIALPTLNEIVVLNPDDIIYCEGDSNYTNLFLSDGTKLCLAKTLKVLEDFLPEDSYFRIHNTHIVNLNRIVRILRRDSGYITMDNGKELAISRSRRDDFFKKINLLRE
jgi:two-component system LytT family response regulator